MSDPFEDDDSLFNELMREGKKQNERPPMRLGLSRDDAEHGETALPFSTEGMSDDEVKELIELIQGGDVNQVLERLNLTKDMMRLVMLAHGLIDTMLESVKDHVAIVVMDPDHNCGLVDGVLPPEASEVLADLEWEQEHADAFAIVEANMLGMMMMMRTSILDGGFELPVYSQFPDVPGYAKSGAPPEGADVKMDLSQCEVCGEYSVLCECE
jgi:hypothetical protein